MKLLVAVDGGVSSDIAFRTACAVARPDDTLLLVSVVQDVQRQYYQSLAPHLPPFPSFVDAQRAVNGEGRHIVEKYAKLAKTLGVRKVFALLGISTHEGEFLCRLAMQRSVDIIYMGRRGLNSFSRFFMGSTSKYVMEHAECSVCVVKKLPAGLPDVPHSEGKANGKETAASMPAEVAAELEKRRQVDEEKAILEAERKEREAAHIGAVVAEEEERKRRVKEQGVREDRTFHVQIYDFSDEQ